MSETELNIFSSGNSRKLTMNCNADSWQQALHKIDQFIHTSNAITLAGQDIVFQKINGEVQVSREITGFVAEHELASSNIFINDAVDRCCAAKILNESYQVPLLEIFELADDLVLSMQHTDFPKNYGNFNQFEVRLRLDFTSIDHLNSQWLVYMFFDRTSSSILTF